MAEELEGTVRFEGECRGLGWGGLTGVVRWQCT